MGDKTSTIIFVCFLLDGKIHLWLVENIKGRMEGRTRRLLALEHKVVKLTGRLWKVRMGDRPRRLEQSRAFPASRPTTPWTFNELSAQLVVYRAVDPSGGATWLDHGLSPLCPNLNSQANAAMYKGGLWLAAVYRLGEDDDDEGNGKALWTHHLWDSNAVFLGPKQKYQKHRWSNWIRVRWN